MNAVAFGVECCGRLWRPENKSGFAGAGPWAGLHWSAPRSGCLVWGWVREPPQRAAGAAQSPSGASAPNNPGTGLQGRWCAPVGYAEGMTWKTVVLPSLIGAAIAVGGSVLFIYAMELLKGYTIPGEWIAYGIAIVSFCMAVTLATILHIKHGLFRSKWRA